VSKARLLLPLPETPVMTTNLLRGKVKSTFFKLCCCAPRMTNLSWYMLSFRLSGPASCVTVRGWASNPNPLYPAYVSDHVMNGSNFCSNPDVRWRDCEAGRTLCQFYHGSAQRPTRRQGNACRANVRQPSQPSSLTDQNVCAMMGIALPCVARSRY
jgi:hypothetical protein